MNSLSKADYIVVRDACLKDSDLEGVIQRCAPNWTVCPECRVDDFTHSSDCSLLGGNQ